MQAGMLAGAYLVAGQASAPGLQHLGCIAHTILVEVADTNSLGQTLQGSNMAAVFVTSTSMENSILGSKRSVRGEICISGICGMVLLWP
jgi:hypothetical protein